MGPPFEHWFECEQPSRGACLVSGDEQGCRLLPAVGKGLLIFAYFVVATVWLPSWLFNSVTGVPAALHDIIGTAVWLVFMLGGLWALRWSQAKGWI